MGTLTCRLAWTFECLEFAHERQSRGARARCGSATHTRAPTRLTVLQAYAWHKDPDPMWRPPHVARGRHADPPCREVPRPGRDRRRPPVHITFKYFIILLQNPAGAAKITYPRARNLLLFARTHGRSASALLGVCKLHMDHIWTIWSSMHAVNAPTTLRAA